MDVRKPKPFARKRCSTSHMALRKHLISTPPSSALVICAARNYHPRVFYEELGLGPHDPFTPIMPLSMLINSRDWKDINKEVIWYVMNLTTRAHLWNLLVIVTDHSDTNPGRVVNKLRNLAMDARKGTMYDGRKVEHIHIHIPPNRKGSADGRLVHFPLMDHKVIEGECVDPRLCVARARFYSTHRAWFCYPGVAADIAHDIRSHGRSDFVLNQLQYAVKVQGTKQINFNPHELCLADEVEGEKHDPCRGATLRPQMAQVAGCKMSVFPEFSRIPIKVHYVRLDGKRIAHKPNPKVSKRSPKALAAS